MMQFKIPALGGNNSSIRIIAIVLSILAGISVYFAFKQLYEPVPVVVASRSIDGIKQINSSDVTVATVAKRDRHPEAFTSTKQVMDSYSAAPIYQGQQIITPQVVRDPGKMIVESLNMQMDETFLTLKVQDASWPQGILKSGDLVTIMGVYPDIGVIEEAVGRVVTASGGSIAQDVKTLRDAETKMSGTEITLSLKVEDAKRVLLAVNKTKGVYLLPRHPGFGGSIHVEQ